MSRYTNQLNSCKLSRRRSWCQGIQTSSIVVNCLGGGRDVKIYKPVQLWLIV